MYEDLRDIVLLGFSYGGFVVTGALEHIAERVRHLVYLDAFVPDDGDTVDATGSMAAGCGVIGLGRDWLDMVASNRPTELAGLLLELT